MLLDGNIQRKFLTDLQDQYGTLLNAANYYFDGRMPDEQSRKFEQAAGPFLAMAAQLRLSFRLTTLVEMLATPAEGEGAYVRRGVEQR